MIHKEWKCGECKHCKKIFDNLSVQDKANHSRWCDENPKSAMRKHKTLSCVRCGIQFQLLNPKDKKRTCQYECQHSHTDEQKKKLQDIRKEFLKLNPDKHVWKRSNKFKSVPCENVKSFLIKRDISFIEEYSPSEEKHYSIDVAFPNLKIGVEINGNQHYNKDGTLEKYYRERHDYLVALGWRLIEVHYSRCFSDESIEKIFDFSIPFDQNEEIERIKVLLNKPKKHKRQREEAIVDRYSPGWKLWEEKKNVIFEHDIDFSRYGWVQRVALVLGIKGQKVNKWMKKYQPEFYEQHCYTRKNNIS